MTTDREAATRALDAFAEDYRTRKAELDGQLADLQAERDKAIRAAFVSGLTTREIASKLDISHQRVGQIVLDR